MSVGRLDLSSSDGWSKLSAEVAKVWRHADHGRLLLAELGLTSKFWPRDRSLVSDDTCSPQEDFSVRLRQVVLRQEAMEELAARLDRWLATPGEFSLELSGVEHQSFVVQFGARDEVICSVEKPAFTALYTGGKMLAGEWYFLVDQSCIRLLRDDVHAMLAEANRAQVAE